MAGSTGEVVKSLVVNAIIASSKGVAAALTGSGAMLAETLHSFADCGNQLLLLVGIKQSHKPADPKHPLGYGRAMYFYSFIVALLLFSGGGLFSIYEGAHKLQHPEKPGEIGVALIILAISLCLEGWSLFGNIKMMNERRKSMGFFRYLRETKDSDLIVVAGENSAAVLGLVFALAAIAIAHVTQDGRWDAAGSLLIGVVLVGVAVFLAIEIKSLIIGESADPECVEIVQKLVDEDPDIESLIRMMSVQQGPGEIMVAMKLKFRDGIPSEKLVEIINGFETRLHDRMPAVKWSFVEPDTVD